MKYGSNAYFNQERGASFDGYAPGDTTKMSTMVVLPEATTPEDAAEQVYALMNADDRPNGKTERSLSVGDVVKIVAPNGSYWFAVDRVGFKPIAPLEGS